MGGVTKDGEWMTKNGGDEAGTPFPIFTLPDFSTYKCFLSRHSYRIRIYTDDRTKQREKRNINRKPQAGLFSVLILKSCLIKDKYKNPSN